jgi:hypothetical protein
LVRFVPIESAIKTDVLASLEKATAGGTDGGYTKTPRRAAKVIKLLDPEAIKAKAPRFGKRFFEALL